jgi:glycosyltransferase involved in cell wall biosynthesis
MKILWFTWKDLTNPLAGGAEVVNEQLAKRLVKDGHQVTLIVGGYKGSKPEETHPDGYKIIRLGNRLTVFWQAFRYYRRNLKGWADLVIDEINTVPFFCKFYVQEPNIIFAHMLCRQIWFTELPPLLSLIGYLAEPVYLHMLRDKTVITVSDSTKQDLMKVGFKPANIHIISEGLDIPVPKQLPPQSSKAKTPTMLSLGAMRAMKRTLHQIEAFELAKASIPNLKLEVAGDNRGKYGQKVMKAIASSRYAKDITYHGRVSAAKKIELMRRSRLITVTSTKEGWGLIVTEANSQGTPAAVYNVDGLRDSVRDGQTGLITERNTPQQLAKAIVTLLTNNKRYAAMRMAAWQWSKTITFDKSYRQFKKAINV